MKFFFTKLDCNSLREFHENFNATNEANNFPAFYDPRTIINMFTLLGAVYKLCRLRWREGSKISDFTNSKKAAKRGVGGQKLRILRRHNVCLKKIRSKCSSVLLLCLQRFFMRQTLVYGRPPLVLLVYTY